MNRTSRAVSLSASRPSGTCMAMLPAIITDSSADMRASAMP